MSDFIIEKYKAEHGEALIADGEVPWTTDVGQAKLLEKSNFSVTVLINDDPVMCSGIIDLWEGCGEGWFIAAKELLDYPVTLSRATKEVLHEEIVKTNYRRVQVNVRADWEVAIRFSKFLGFKEEGLMQKFGPEGADYLRMSIVQ